MNLLIVGCGYVGSEVVQQVTQSYETIFALTRSSERARELLEIGAQPLIGDWLDPESLKSLPAIEHVLVSVPHRADDNLQADTHVVGLRNLLAQLKTWSRLIYLSTTGVYGQVTGRVDETTPLSPTRIGPEIATVAEAWLKQEFTPERCTVLRLAGIYGPGRIPLAQKLKDGESLKVPHQGHLNLVHVSDIAAMILQLFSRLDLPRMDYIFSDGHPVLRMEFYTHLAELCGVANPKFEESSANDSRTRRATDKQICPDALLHATGFKFRFPNYKAGLANSLGI